MGWFIAFISSILVPFPGGLYKMLSIYISTLDIIVKVDTSRYLLTMLHWPGSGQNIKKNPKTSQPTYSTLSQVWGGSSSWSDPAVLLWTDFKYLCLKTAFKKILEQGSNCHFCQEMHFLGRKWHFLWKVYFIQKWSVAQNTVFQGVKYNLNINVVVSLSSNWSCAAAGPLSIVCLLCCAAHAA